MPLPRGRVVLNARSFDPTRASGRACSRLIFTTPLADERRSTTSDVATWVIRGGTTPPFTAL